MNIKQFITKYKNLRRVKLLISQNKCPICEMKLEYHDTTCPYKPEK